MDGICNRLLNVKGMVVEDACIVDPPLRPVPVLEVRPRPRGGMLRTLGRSIEFLGPPAPARGHAPVLPMRQTPSWVRPGRRRASLASPGLRLPEGRTGRRPAARGPPEVRRRGRLRAVGGAGQPVHQGFRGGVRVADDGREPEDGRRFPSYRVEDRGRRRPSGRRTRQGVDALAVRRPDGDRRGRDQLQEGPRTWPWSSTTSGIG